MRLRHVGITVCDLEKMQAFYCRAFDCKALKRMEESGECIDNFSGMKSINVTTLKMQFLGGGILELLKYHGSHSTEISLKNQYKKITHVGISHFAITVNNLDTLYGKLAEEGTVFIYPVQTSPDGNVKIAFCRDPEGNLLELVEEL